MTIKSYMVWCPDRGEAQESARRIKAYDTEEAAETWAKLYDRDSADYSIVGGNDCEVKVLECKEGAHERTYKVSGEMVAWYTAEIVGVKK